MSSSYSVVEQHKNSDLPEEVLANIFKYLSVNERKAVKLVCKRWLKSCNTHPLLNEEVLTCLNIYQLSDTYKLLDKSNRQLLNLKFENVIFHDDPSFWNTNGLRIRSIDFKDCHFDNSILEEIIICCENLNHLSFTYTADFENITCDKKPPIPGIIDVEKVSAKGIVRENLNSLEIYIVDSYLIRLSDHILHQLLLIFPNVKILRITSDFFAKQEVCMDLSEVPSREHITMCPILNYLIVSRRRIEKLKLHFTKAEFSQSSLHLLLKTLSLLDRLTELCIGMRNIAHQIDFLFSMRLKSLEFRMAMPPDFLSQLLDSNSNLQYLKIYQRSESIFTKSFCEKLISSGLKRLVTSDIDMEDPASCASSLSTQNQPMVLPSLSVSLGRFPLPLLQHYHSLLTLECVFISSNSMQSVLRYQKKLRSFKIDCRRYLRKAETFQGDLTFNELTDIEYLELTYAPAAAFFLRTLLPEPILAKLKYLRIDVAAVDAELFSSDLLRSVDAMPFLEGLYVFNAYLTPRTFNVIVRLCLKLSRLRYLYFMGYRYVKGVEFTDEQYRQLFSICPSLRVLVHYGTVIVTYFFDTIHKEVRRKEDLNEDVPEINLSRPRIGDLTVSWMKF